MNNINTLDLFVDNYREGQGKRLRIETKIFLFTPYTSLFDQCMCVCVWGGGGGVRWRGGGGLSELPIRNARLQKGVPVGGMRSQ